MTQNDYVAVMQERLDWCVQTERYEMAARLRDLIEYETTGDENVMEFKPDWFKLENYQSHPSIKLPLSN
jgi:thymidylate synthase